MDGERGCINMTFEEQANIARAMTGSTMSTSEIIRNVMNTDNATKNIVSQQVHSVVKEYNMPFDKAFPIIKRSFNQIARNYNMDPAVLFWIYMDWTKKNN